MISIGGGEIFKFIMPELLILVPVLMIIGLILKKTPKISDWTIPYILSVLGIVLSGLILGFYKGFTSEIILTAVLQGILNAGVSVYIHQLIIQPTRKKDS